MGIIELALIFLCLLSLSGSSTKEKPQHWKWRRDRVRDFDVSTLQFVQRVGYERSIPLNGIGSYLDGMSCFTGQSPWNRWEATEAKKLFKVHFWTTHEVRSAGIYSSGRYEDYTNSCNLTLGQNCLSKNCSFDLRRYVPICGLLPRPYPLFPDSRSCLDGTEPLRAKPELTHQEEGFGVEPKPWPNDMRVKLESKLAQERYGGNCQSGKCFYDFPRGSYICRASLLSPQSLSLSLLAMCHLGLPIFGFKTRN